MDRENLSDTSGSQPQERNSVVFPLAEPNYEMQFRLAARTILRRPKPAAPKDVLIALSDGTGRITSILQQPKECTITPLLVKETIWANNSAIGHNGLGNSIRTQQPAVVIGSEHTLAQLKECFTIGYPIIRDDMGLVGAILLAGACTSYKHTLLSWINNQVALINKYIDNDQIARKMATSMLLEENMRLVAATSEQPSHLGIAIVGTHGQLIEVSASVQALIDHTEGELLQAAHSPLDKLLLEQIDLCLKQQTIRFAEIPPFESHGDTPIFISCQPLIDTTRNSAIGAMIIFYDPSYTPQRAIPAHQALTHLDDDVVILDQTGRIVFSNRFPPEDLGRHYLEVVFKGQKYRSDGEHNSLLIQALETGQEAITRIYQTPDGTRTRQTDIRLLKDQDNKLVGVVGIRKDITEEQQLKKQLVHSERLSMIGELAAQTIHELRNPLAAIRASAQLGIGLDESEKNSILARIITEIDKMNDFVTNILLLAKPEKASFQSENLGKIMDSVLHLHKAKIIMAGIDVVKNYSRDNLSPISANSKLLEQAIINVINNALDAMKAGGILTITILDSPDKALQELIIADTGAGMTSKQMDNLFQPFYTTKGDGGTGLGLAITKQIIAETHGGKIWVESELGKGTQVHIEITKVELCM